MDNGHITILHQDWCKGCGLCIEICPNDVLGFKEEKVFVKNVENCTACVSCELICPDYVLKVVKDDG